MKQLLLGGISLGAHLYLFLAFGSLLLRLSGKEKRFSWCFAPVLGMFVYYGVFEILALPMTFLLVPLHVLTAVWGAILAVAGIAAAVFCGRNWVENGKKTIRVMGERKGLFLFLILLTGIQAVYEAVYSANTADAAYYIGNVSTSLYTDTLGRYDPYTGALMKTFQVRYVTATYYLDSAVFCRIFGVHPMVLLKTIAPIMIIFLANLLYYHLGMELFSGNRKRAAGFTAAMLFFGVLSGAPIYGGFLYYRTFEGKAILHGLVIPFLFLSFLRLYEDTKDGLSWWSVFWTSLGAVCLTTSSMMMVPAAVFAGTAALMFLRKKVKPAFLAFLCILPDVMVTALYLAVQLRMITLPAQ